MPYKPVVWCNGYACNYSGSCHRHIMRRIPGNPYVKPTGAGYGICINETTGRFDHKFRIPRDAKGFKQLAEVMKDDPLYKQKKVKVYNAEKFS